MCLLSALAESLGEAERLSVYGTQSVDGNQPLLLVWFLRRRDSARVYQFTLKHDLLKRNLSIEAKFIPQL